MLTRCPQCATTFRVSPQQLKVHRGEVRCGRCSTIFDAFESLVAEPTTPPVKVPAPNPVHAPEPVPVEAEAVEPAPPAETPDEQSSLGTQLRPDLRFTVPEFSPGGGKAKTRPAKKAKGKRWPWIALASVSVVTLIAQAAFAYRADLTANTVVMWPETKPWFERACAELHCVLPLPRRVDLVGIDASDLQVDTGHANLMLLTATLKNRAAFAQEYPALALTLMDSQDQALARRVLTPADYLDPKTDSRAGFPANADLAVKVFIDSREFKATGYRLFVYYP
jgi:predicted Zn finger-like uncharacterized protein